MADQKPAMHKMTEENMRAAFAGESQAHIRYMAFSQRAQRDSKPNIARLFEAVSYAEQVHAGNHLRVLSGVGDTLANLGTAWALPTKTKDAAKVAASRSERMLKSSQVSTRQKDRARGAERTTSSLLARTMDMLLHARIADIATLRGT